MAFEDFTTYTEVDPDSEVTVISSKVSWSSLDQDTDTYVYSDKGVGHFSGDFTHQFKFKVSSQSSNGTVIGWALTNSVNDWQSLLDATEDFVSIRFFSQGQITLSLLDAGSLKNDSWTSASLGTTYFITVVRNDSGGANGTGKYVVYIRTGSHRGTLHDTLELDASTGEQNDFRYIFSLQSRNSSEANKNSTGFTQNLDLNEEKEGTGFLSWGSMTSKISGQLGSGFSIGPTMQ